MDNADNTTTGPPNAGHERMLSLELEGLIYDSSSSHSSSFVLVHGTTGIRLF
jgi:hypothetical protein